MLVWELLSSLQLAEYPCNRIILFTREGNPSGGKICYHVNSLSATRDEFFGIRIYSYKLSDVFCNKFKMVQRWIHMLSAKIACSRSLHVACWSILLCIDLATTYHDGDDENVQKKSKTDLGYKRNITRVNTRCRASSQFLCGFNGCQAVVNFLSLIEKFSLTVHLHSLFYSLKEISLSCFISIFATKWKACFLSAKEWNKFCCRKSLFCKF